MINVKLTFRCIILIGIFLPLVLLIVVGLAIDYRSLLQSFNVFDFFSLFPLLLWNGLPFIIFAFIVKSLLIKVASQNSQIYLPHKIGIVGAGTMALGINLFLYIDTFVAAFKHLPGFSTAGLIFIFVPFYAFISMPIGYCIGWLIGKLLNPEGK